MDWNALYLFELITMRVSGFVFTNPLFGRNNLTSLVKAGVALVLSVFAWTTEDASVTVPATVVELVVRLLLELCVGMILAFVMQLFFSVVQLGGEVIDAQMGLNMAQVYDSSSQVNMTVTTSLLNVLLVLIFFAGSVVPYGTVSLGSAVVSGIVEVFASCMVLAVKLALPILAAELLGELGMGILMKAIPQINAFVINMELKIIIGLMLLLAFLTPINEFLLDVEKNMLDTLGGMLQVIAGAG